MKKTLLLLAAVFSTFAATLVFTSCDPAVVEPTLNALGYFGEDNLDTVPTNVSFGNGAANLPSSVDLTTKFPPVGNQGQYGTCVAWAVAYNYKSTIDGIAKGVSASEMASPSRQFSPKDLFTAIPDANKGANCNGTNFSYALNLAQERGIATMATVPYTGLSSCSQSSVQSNWTTEANQYKIKSWRKISGTLDAIKQNLANNIPVILGAKLADNFMSYSGGVISSASGYNQVGMHAYHAMVIGGYDDNKGANGAFKLVNTWGTNWGSSGYVWVDYNFFINEFCKDGSGEKPLFIAETAGGNAPPNNNPTNNTGVDLAAWASSDISLYSTATPTERVINFNLYNIGTVAAKPSSNWSLYYIYYNAYDANDYGIIFYDEFNTTVAANTFDCPTDYNCVINYSLPAKDNLANVLFPNETALEQTYYMPDISGEYYLVLYADPDDVFAEAEEMNNIFYTTEYPKSFSHGYAARTSQPFANNTFAFKNPLSPSSENIKQNRFNSAVTPSHKNAYRPDEIMNFFKREKASGRLQEKARQARKMLPPSTIRVAK
jgi:hypothetical protein